MHGFIYALPFGEVFVDKRIKVIGRLLQIKIENPRHHEVRLQALANQNSPLSRLIETAGLFCSI